MPKSPKPKKKGGKSAAAHARNEARKDMLPQTGGVASVDLEVDPTVITTPSTAADHPVGEDLADAPQVVDPDAQAAKDAAGETEEEKKSE